MTETETTEKEAPQQEPAKPPPDIARCPASIETEVAMLQKLGFTLGSRVLLQAFGVSLSPPDMKSFLKNVAELLWIVDSPATMNLARALATMQGAPPKKAFDLLKEAGEELVAQTKDAAEKTKTTASEAATQTETSPPTMTLPEGEIPT